MRRETVDVQVERRVPPVLLDEAYRPSKRPGRRPFFLGLLRLHVHDVRPDAVLVSSVLAQQLVIRVRDRAPPILCLATDELPLPESPREVHAGDEVVWHVGDESRVVSGLNQPFRDGRFVR